MTTDPSRADWSYAAERTGKKRGFLTSFFAAAATGLVAYAALKMGVDPAHVAFAAGFTAAAASFVAVTGGLGGPLRVGVAANGVFGGGAAVAAASDIAIGAGFAPGREAEQAIVCSALAAAVIAMSAALFADITYDMGLDDDPNPDRYTDFDFGRVLRGVLTGAALSAVLAFSAASDFKKVEVPAAPESAASANLLHEGRAPDDAIKGYVP